MDFKNGECTTCDAGGQCESVATSKYQHMDHSATKKRISRARGQLEAVVRMIDEARYCPEIIYQMRAVTNALKAAEQEILQRHLRGCVKTALESTDAFEADEKIKEIMKLMNTN